MLGIISALTVILWPSCLWRLGPPCGALCFWGLDQWGLRSRLPDRASLVSLLTACSTVGPVAATPPTFGSVTMSAESSRREALATFASGAALAAFAPAAFADGAASMTTVSRARGIYGGRIAELKVRSGPEVGSLRDRWWFAAI